MVRMPVRKKDLLGQRFGRLVVISEAAKNKNGARTWVCKCDCGNITHPIVQGNLLRTKSCGCLRRSRLHETPIGFKHGKSNSRLYMVWQGMKQRCSTPTHKAYAYYGGRGITVCDEWANSYELFAEWSYANGYDETAGRGKCTIDRVDVNGNYCPENCRWVDMKIQQNNKRNSKVMDG